MPINCGSAKKIFRYRKIKGGKQRLGGCKLKSGKFVIKEVKIIKSKIRR